VYERKEVEIVTNNAEEVRIQTILREFIPSITKADDIAALFSLLEYPAENIHERPLRRKKESFDLRKEDEERISNIYSPMSFGEDIPVFLLETTSLAPSFIRSATNTLDHQYLRFMVIFTIDYSEILFVYPKTVKDEKGKRKLKITKLILKKEDLHYTEIRTLARLSYQKNATWRAVWRRWGKAFTVESVAGQFFEDYKRLFFRVRERVSDQGFSRQESHEFALQLLNRVMFIYFIAEKGWLKQPRFVKWLWASYTSENRFGTDTFYRDRLSQVFFKAFNNKGSEITGFSDDVSRLLLTVPHLNGGLFTEKDTDRMGATVSDEMFKEVLTFFEKYNFTIREADPLDEEVAVDPRMIGYVYESLANVAEEIYDRNDLGIFYTARIEVDFMCRRALVGSLMNQLPDLPGESLYHFVFDSPEDDEKTGHINGDPEIWFRIERILNDLSIVDPACGSGAFLVGMLSVLTELYQTVYARMASTRKSVFDIKYGIIQRSLYGVDVMPWAVRAAELRLWLHPIVDADVSIEDLRKGPLLPNPNLHLRVGDSMVQETGGVSFSIRSRGLDEGVRRDLKSVKSVLDDPEKKPFIWDIDFAEVFGEKNGFDIVIGNPPYVRQEMISPPNRIKAEVTLEDRREYKEKLIHSVRTQFPVIQNIDRKSDLYIYFYFHGLSLLNENGVVCFITSNSWLDVGYGKDLQEFLLKYVPIHAIYDNPKRSFEHADVNTIIAVFGAPALRGEAFEEKIRTGVDAPWTGISNTAKFVMFKKPFEEVVSAETMIAVDRTQARVKGGNLTDLIENIVQTDECRIFSITQEDLLEDGWEYPEEYDRDKGRFGRGRYIGNKWGKYLRAPDIFYTILKKGKGKFIKLRETAKIQRGFTTGANEFFYLTEQELNRWNIEVEFVKPIIKSPREFNSLIIDPSELKTKIFLCDRGKSELTGTNALKYIEWGESRGYDKRPSCRTRARWYSIGALTPEYITRSTFNTNFSIFYNKYRNIIDKVMYGISPLKAENKENLGLMLNSTVFALFLNIFGQIGLGEGALFISVENFSNIPVLVNLPEDRNNLERRVQSERLMSIFSESGLTVTRPLREQIPDPDETQGSIDEIIFKELGLNEMEINEVYWAVCEMVKHRIEKANSIFDRNKIDIATGGY